MRRGFLGVLALIACGSAWAADADDYRTLSLRVGLLVTQKRLASPPLPDLGDEDKHHLTPQFFYLTGNIKSDVPGGSYSGNPIGYGGGISYRSPTVGNFSFFAYGLFAQAVSDFLVSFTDPSVADVQVKGSKTETQVGGVGVNYVLMGDRKSLLALGIFTGAYYGLTQTKYNFDVRSTPATRSKVSWDGTNYGVASGLQLRLRKGLFSALSYVMYAYDFAPQCHNETIDGALQPCQERLNSSFGAYGLGVGFWRFSASVYSKLWTQIPASDVNVMKFQLGYTIVF